MFVHQGVESDYFGGYVQRDNSDLGAKYNLIKAAEENLISEAGCPYTKTNPSTGADLKYENYGRLYAEYSRKMNEAVSFKLWFEYLPNFTQSEAYLLNHKASLSSVVNSVLSVKISYLTKFHNLTVKMT